MPGVGELHSRLSRREVIGRQHRLFLGSEEAPRQHARLAYREAEAPRAGLPAGHRQRAVTASDIALGRPAAALAAFAPTLDHELLGLILIGQGGAQPAWASRSRPAPPARARRARRPRARLRGLEVPARRAKKNPPRP
ncbi:hypothetical protein [Nannocystis pusilla]|uniref:hypothetical protein n=1 Tax=Nannocystis pusilla TaxID=889268 RepID=UPI003DA24DA1